MNTIPLILKVIPSKKEFLQHDNIMTTKILDKMFLYETAKLIER
jgi:hypothetical protein